MSVVLLPKSKLRTNSTKKTKNKILAIPAAPAAIPPNPNIAAMMATIKKMTVQRNIIKGFICEQMLFRDIDKKMCHNYSKRCK